MPEITKKLVDSAKPTNKRYYLRDSEVKGFCLAIEPNGKKIYRLQYRVGKGRDAAQKWMTIGEHGTYTVQQAREKASDYKKMAREGKDPQEVLKAARVISLGAVCDRYLEEHCKTHNKPKTVEEYSRYIKNTIKPKLGHKDIKQVSKDDVERLHRSLKDKPYAANRVLALLSLIFNLCEGWELREDNSNPCKHVKRFKEESRERFLSGDELARLGDALEETLIAEPESKYFVAAIKLLLFTGCRKEEIFKLKWSYIDMASGAINLPDSKTGRKTIILNDPALEVVQTITPVSGNPYVIASRQEKKYYRSPKKAWDRLMERAGITGLRIHDLRHSFASEGAASNLALPIIGKLLGHTQQQTTQRYSHLYDDPIRQASQLIGARIAEGMRKKGGSNE